MTPNTRRQHERYNCEMVVWMKYAATNGEYILADVENISSGGILINSIEPMEMGMELELKVSLLQIEDMVAVQARVCHVRKNEQDEFLVGLQFLATDGVSFPTFMACLEAMFS